jgi:hypothetical protein
MVVEITIPQGIINICKECGWNENQTKAIFLAYVEEVTDHPYNHFEIEFDNWINGDTQDYLDEILQENNH